MSRYTKISNQVVWATDIDISVDKENGTINVEFITGGEVIPAHFSPEGLKKHIKHLQKAASELKWTKDISDVNLTR